MRDHPRAGKTGVGNLIGYYQPKRRRTQKAPRPKRTSITDVLGSGITIVVRDAVPAPPCQTMPEVRKDKLVVDFGSDGATHTNAPEVTATALK